MAELVLSARTLTIEGTNERVLKACLLVYDDENFSDEALSNDLREQLESDPSIDRIYVAAPRVSSADLLDQIGNGTSLIRTSQHENQFDPLLRVITSEKNSDGRFQLHDVCFTSDKATRQRRSFQQPLDSSLIQAWFFDLFVQNKGMVLAPSGVHFGKTSGKHADRFLRAANVLLTSAVCRLIAFFCLPLLPKRRLRQVYVDTAPLLSVGLAVIELCKFHGVPINSGRIKSFSSYAGLHDGTEFRESDLLLISASTSGGLVTQLLNRGASEDATITTFYLQAKGWKRTSGLVLADLTHAPGMQHGFAEVLSYEHGKCPLCTAGVLLAEFEGDQFLLQKRKTKRLKVTKRSQHIGARNFLELAARRQAILVSLVGSGRSRTPEIHFDMAKIASSDPGVQKDLTFRIRRAVPAPLDMIVSDDTSVSDLSTLSSVNGRSGIDPKLTQLTSNNLEGTAPISEAGVLVYFSTLNNDLLARSINRSLRSVAPRGSISYLSALLVVDSPEAKRDLLSFVKYGERGPNTFQFDSVFDLQLTQREERLPWVLEHELLAQQSQTNLLPDELESRLSFLMASARHSNQLFLKGQAGELAIASDFVYLDTTKNGVISHGDIYAVVANLLASCRNDDREIDKPLKRGDEPQLWENSIYGQVLLCPRNFKDYNDGVLHAAFLRAAKISELRYDTDSVLSEEMLEILLSEIQSWQYRAGQALAEFAMAIATGRLNLVSKHLEEVARALTITTFVPDWIKFIFAARA